MEIMTCSAEGTHREAAERLPGLLRAGTAIVWVDMTGPTRDDVAVMERIFRFHPLAIEDTRNHRQRPKVEEYGDYLFIILNSVEQQSKTFRFQELDIFIGRNYVVTVHAGPEPAIAEAQRRLARPGGLAASPGGILYVLMDTVVDEYFPVVDWIGEELDRLEEAALNDPSDRALRQLLEVKTWLSTLARVAGPQRDMFNVLMHPDLPFAEQAPLQYHLRDIYDHLLRITDMVNTHRDYLNTLIEVHMSAVANHLNRVVNRLTAVTIIVGALGAVSGFYGMNFEHNWPPFSAPWGVLYVLTVMGVIVAGLVYVFRRYDWL